MAKKKNMQICIMTVTGVDKVGIIARLATTMAKANINIVDVNQKIMEDYFVMMMGVDIANATIGMDKIRKQLDKLSKEISLNITFQDENIFNVMHRV
ncbi:MAG: ACT domain-containing protein [Planctomycetota bacterium]|jgi:ACT domain-containing protein